MNFYPRYPAHYVAKTLHLTMEQDGAYTRLLDWCYANERGIKNCQKYAISRAKNLSERRATDAVLEEFFSLENDAWTNGRTADEIAVAQPKIEAARHNGRKGGRPKKNPVGLKKEPSGFQETPEKETHWVPDRKAPQSPISIEAKASPRAPIPTPSPPTVASPTDAGRACLLMRRAGCLQTNPSHPNLLAAIAEGATPEALGNYAELAVKTDKRNPFAYAIAAARGDIAAPPAYLTTGATNGQRAPITRKLSAVERVVENVRRARIARGEDPED